MQSGWLDELSVVAWEGIPATHDERADVTGPALHPDSYRIMPPGDPRDGAFGQHTDWFSELASPPPTVRSRA